jgi:CspA family cold shock protein
MDFLDVSYAAVIKWRRDSVAKRTTGVVRCFDGSKGYGYIDAKDGEDVFVHYSALTGIELPLLLKGDQVGFFLKETVQGPQAIDVYRLN